jgi:dolichol kinase
MFAATSAISYFYMTHTPGALVLLALGMILTVSDYFRVKSETWRSWLPEFILRLVRGREKTRLSAITHFVIAATCIDFLYLFAGLPKEAALAATMYAAIGDPLARLCGIRFGKTTILSTRKTWVGSGALFVAGFSAAVVTAKILGAPLSLGVIAVGGVVITAIEMFSNHWDNFSVPFFGTLAIWGLLAVGF